MAVNECKGSCWFKMLLGCLPKAQKQHPKALHSKTHRQGSRGAGSRTQTSLQIACCSSIVYPDVHLFDGHFQPESQQPSAVFRAPNNEQWGFCWSFKCHNSECLNTLSRSRISLFLSQVAFWKALSQVVSHNNFVFPPWAFYTRPCFGYIAVLILASCHSQSFLLLDFSANAVAHSDVCVQMGVWSKCCMLGDHFPVALFQGLGRELVPSYRCRKNRGASSCEVPELFNLFAEVPPLQKQNQKEIQKFTIALGKNMARCSFKYSFSRVIWVGQIKEELKKVQYNDYHNLPPQSEDERGHGYWSEVH